MSTDAVFGAFSVSLLIAAAIGPRVGRTIDEFGGRAVLWPKLALSMYAAAHSTSVRPLARRWRSADRVWQEALAYQARF